MHTRTRVELAQALRRRRAALLKQSIDAEVDLESIADDREPELEERAQQECAARILASLDDRTLGEVTEIDAALHRLVDGIYGKCVDCGRAIPLMRLRALPTTTFCVECAREEGDTPPPPPSTAETRPPGRLPPDLEPLLDRDVEEALREFVREDGRVDMDDLHIVGHRGLIQLEGTLPSEAEHGMLVKLVTDVAGCQDVVDHVRVDELQRERLGRGRPLPRDRNPASRFEPIGTEDVLDYIPPDRPPPDED